MFTSMLAYLVGNDFILLTLSILVFEVPRYTISLIIVALSGITKYKQPPERPFFTVSAIIPCFNDALAMMDTVNSLALMRHEGLVEVIVVNDGSTDDSLQIAKKLKKEGKVDTIINHHRRQGRSAGVNHGARFARGELFLVVDSDSIVNSEAIIRMQEYFKDSKVSGVTGSILVKNCEESLITALQALEYLVSITAGKAMLDMLGAVGCLSGAFSMYRKSYFLDLGGMDAGGGEDLELTLRMRKAGYSVRFDPLASSQTDVPSNFLSLMRQRIRWDSDAYWLRVIQYKETSLFQPGETFSDTFRRIDFILFDLISTLVFPAYLIYLTCVFERDTIYFFAALYVLTMIMYFVNIAVAMAFVPHNFGIFEGLAVFILPFYQGVVMKIVRFYSFSAEILWQISKDDDYTPKQVRVSLHQS